MLEFYFWITIVIPKGCSPSSMIIVSETSFCILDIVNAIKYRDVIGKILRTWFIRPVIFDSNITLDRAIAIGTNRESSCQVWMLYSAIRNNRHHELPFVDHWS